MKKKILLLSDDLRIPSGVGTMSKALVESTIHKYDWVQIGGAIKHPEEGKVFDLCKSVQEQTGIEDAYCKLYAVSGYGNKETLRHVMKVEKPDAVLHFTDPRFWDWLYNMEHELRQEVPLMYLNIWDDLPYPHWNENFYESCDLLMAISKQTFNINRQVCRNKPRVEGKDLFYVPHGLDENIYHPVDKRDESYIEMRKQLVGDADVDFIAMFNSRNIQRKRPADLILAYKLFCDKLTKEQSDKCMLILHTDPIDNNGTDLPAVAKNLCPEYKIAFSNAKLSREQLNLMYNVADVVCNPSSAEGFGLSHMEAMMAGTPTIATVLGGLQDQMGFKVRGKELNTDHFTIDVPTNSTGMISTEHGEWTYPLYPQLNLQGSPLTPYIYDSRPNIRDIAKGLEHWWKLESFQRSARGKKGREWAIANGFTQKAMGEFAIDAMDACLDNFTPRKRYTLIDTNKPAVEKYKGLALV